MGLGKYRSLIIGLMLLRWDCLGSWLGFIRLIVLSLGGISLMGVRFRCWRKYFRNKVLMICYLRLRFYPLLRVEPTHRIPSTQPILPLNRPPMPPTLNPPREQPRQSNLSVTLNKNKINPRYKITIIRSNW